MKNVTKWGAVILVCILAIILYVGVVREQVPEAVSFGSADAAGGTWRQAERTLDYICPLPAQQDGGQVLLLQTHWQDYTIFVDEQTVFATTEKHTGAVHLFQLPAGETLTIRFYYEDTATVSAIEQSKVVLGSRSGIYQKLISENLYAVLFAAFALAASAVSLYAGIRMRGKPFGTLAESLLSLSAYIFCAGVWVLTDAKVLLLATQRTGLVELISFLAFYILPIPLLQFTKNTIPSKKKLLGTLQNLLVGMMLLFVANYLTGMWPTEALIIAEHLLMGMTIVLMLYSGVHELKQRTNERLRHVVFGYVVFSVCSVASLVFFYLGNSLMYSRLYVLGILGFIFFLCVSAWISVYEQIQQNANVETYAKMAYLDMMTGLGNRAAFMEDTRRNSAESSLAYIMVDVNNLKKVNDELGHQRGDELIVQISDCIKRAVLGGACYRIGGDEFIIRLKGATEAEVLDCASRIRAEIEETAAWSDLPVSAAVGCAWSQGRVTDPEVIFREADDAMYLEKTRMKAGRDCQ